jgi:hypothetical protein
MGKHQKVQVEEIRALLTAGAEIALIPEVADAMAELKAVLERNVPQPALRVATLTTWAAVNSVAAAAPGATPEVEAIHVSLVRSVFATHFLTNRTLH